jgi:hypothetical protein
MQKEHEMRSPLRTKPVGRTFLGWTLLVGAVCVGCGATFTATDGTVFRCHSVTKGTFYFCHDDGPDPILSALTASGAHDLPCASDKVSIAHLSGEEYAGTGCGWRVVYRVPDSLRIELLSRSPLTPGGDQPSPVTAPVPSNSAQPPSPASTTP